jgi:hypothetical protein
MAIKIRLPYNTTAGVIPNSTNMLVGELAVNTADAKLYVKNNAGAVVQINTTGSQGYTGYPGATGPQGAQGVQGPQGLLGFQGSQGATGTQGPTGFQGTQGVQGTQGAQGPGGAQGVRGAQGPTGTQGPQGAIGSQGLTGFTGVQGPQGFQAAAYPPGLPGLAGPQGYQGFTGRTGASGSDYRIKNNIISMSTSIDRLMLLKPVNFSFIDDATNTIVDGFIAHEVQEVVPEAVNGIKDGPEIQTLDQSRLIPIIVKSIQELKQTIDEMKNGN